MLKLSVAGMHRGLRDLLGGGTRESRNSTVLTMSRSAYGFCRCLQHGQNHNSRQRRHMRHYRGGSASVRGGVSAPVADGAPPAHAGGREAGQPVLRRPHRHAEPQRAPVLASNAWRFWKAA